VPPLFIPPIEQLPADHWTDRAGQRIVAIVVHGTGGRDSRATLQHGDGRRVSIHRLITKPGKIYAMLDDARGANHAGAISSSFTLNGVGYSGSRVNKSTLGIELENLQDGRDPYSEPQLSALGWQIADWRRQYGPLPILRHADLDPTRRRDPYQLSTQEIERWTAKYMTPPPIVLPTRRYRVRGIPVYERSDRQGPQWGCLKQDEIIEIDEPSNGHLADGRGFIRLDPDTLESL
jgi:hypothetical protein